MSTGNLYSSIEHSTNSQFQTEILVDAHVHIYNCFDLSRFLDASFGNFSQAARNMGLNKDFIALLMLTESSGYNWFEQLSEFADTGRAIETNQGQTWCFRMSSEKLSLSAESTAGQRLIFVAGRQIVTAEALEVLALATSETFPDGESMAGTISSVRQSGAIAVIPWGFGKWWRNRGRILSTFLHSQAPTELFLGDNSGRAAFLPYPRHFRLAAHRGVRILPGSDPLPFSSEAWRPGSAGFSIRGHVSLTTPAQDLKRSLTDPDTVIRPYIKLESPYRFFRNQFAMQIRKHTTSGKGMK